MHYDTGRPLSLEGLLRDPLTRLVMDADGVTVTEFAAVLHAARDALAAHRAGAGFKPGVRSDSGVAYRSRPVCTGTVW
jgi:hypothetical protein